MQSNTIRLRMVYSLQKETDRVQYYLGKVSWYHKRGYRIRLPKGILLQNTYSTYAVSKAIRQEYQKEKYAACARSIECKWERCQQRFVKALQKRDLPFRKQYTIQLTSYGTNGSYNPPDMIVMNCSPDKHEMTLTICHEICHLSIEAYIRKYRIEHWDKERIVDLMMREFFGSRYGLQTLPSYRPAIDQSFKKYFPDLSKMFKSIAPKVKRGCI